MTQRIRPTVADNVRRYREFRDLSLGEVARRASLSKATLSTLESGPGNPTVTTLAAIANTLDIHPAMLLAVPAPLDERRLIRSDGAERRGTDDVPIERFDVVGEVEVYDVRYEDGDVYRFDGHAPGTVERVMVTEGRLEVGPRDDLVVLGAGDYLAFDASRPHAFTSVRGPVRATLLVASVGAASRQSPIHSATRQ